MSPWLAFCIGWVLGGGAMWTWFASQRLIRSREEWESARSKMGSDG